MSRPGLAHGLAAVFWRSVLDLRFETMPQCWPWFLACSSKAVLCQLHPRAAHRVLSPLLRHASYTTSGTRSCLGRPTCLNEVFGTLLSMVAAMVDSGTLIFRSYCCMLCIVCLPARESELPRHPLGLAGGLQASRHVSLCPGLVCGPQGCLQQTCTRGCSQRGDSLW